MKLKILSAMVAAGSLGYFLYNRIKKQPKEVMSIKRLDDHDYVIYFDGDEVEIEEKFV